jgi:hypothetical protein
VTNEEITELTEAFMRDTRANVIRLIQGVSGIDLDVAYIRRKWLGHRDTAHLSLREAADKTFNELYAERDALRAQLDTLVRYVDARGPAR